MTEISKVLDHVVIKELSDATKDTFTDIAIVRCLQNEVNTIKSGIIVHEIKDIIERLFKDMEGSKMTRSELEYKINKIRKFLFAQIDKLIYIHHTSTILVYND